jgi:eukaryotic-like serine/threonine-protein kinase
MTLELPARIQRFEVCELIGSGGMGSVYRARDPHLDRDVAIKVLSAPSRRIVRAVSADDTLDLRSNAPASSDELVREARIMAQLSHPNVVPVYEIGVADDTLFVVMEFMPAGDLSKWLAASRTTAEILAMFRQAAQGLAQAHARGIVHRDFKPANVLVGGDGRARVADFGLSAVTTAKAAMVRVDDGRGTPRYMAPELWQGVPASMSSDVYAFCSALDEALGGHARDTPDARQQRWRDRGVSKQLTALLAAGLSPQPEQRPALAQLVSALDARPPRRARWIAAGALAVVALSAASAFAVSRSDDSDCNSAEAALDPVRRARLVALQRASPEVIAMATMRDRAVHREVVRTCTMRRDKQLTDEQATMRRSCLLRRVFELGATLDRMIASPARASARLERVATADVCEEITTEPLAADMTAVAAVWARYAGTWELGNGGPESAEAYMAEMRAIQAEAIRLGEEEVEMRAVSGLQSALMIVDRLAEADELLQQNYRKAVALHSTTYAASTLIQRARVASQRRDMKTHAELTALVQDLADKRSVPPTLRARIHRNLGVAARDRGEPKVAAEHYQKALDLIAGKHMTSPTLELELMNQLAFAYSKLDDSKQLAVAVARRGVASARELDPDGLVNQAFAHNMLAVTLSATGDREGALKERKLALDNYSAAMPADHGNVMFARMDYAYDLIGVGRAAEAREHLRAVLDATGRNETVKSERAHVLVDLGHATFDMGQFREGLDLTREGVEGLISQHGLQHARVFRALAVQVAMELELGLVDDASRTTASLQRVVKEQTTNRDRQQAVLDGLISAELELRRNHAKQAEALANRSLTTLLEIKAQPDNLAAVRHVLAAALLAQGRIAEARAHIDAAVALQANLREDDVAERDVTLAKIEAAEGKRMDSIARALRARAVLERYPRHVQARVDAERLIGEHE